MVYSDFNTPSENMNLPIYQIREMLHAQDEAAAKAEEDNALREQAESDRERDDYANYVNDYITSKTDNLNKRNRFLESVKSGFLSAAMMKLYTESFDHKLNKRDKIVGKNLITNFIQEQGTGELLERFKYQNTLLAEMGRIVNKAYQETVETLNKQEDESKIPGRAAELKLDQTVVDDFYKDLCDLDTVEASQLIRDKVADAMSEFIDENLQNRIDYKDIIDQAKEKIQGSQEESAIDDTMNEAKRRINEMRRTRHKNIFHYMVEAVSKQVFKDESLNKRYVHESSVDMDGVVNSAELIYTMLEMVNTTEMVDEDYIRDYIISLTEV